MKESEFEGLVEELLLDLEDVLDEVDADLDVESSAGIMTITCENNGSQIIVSRQPAMCELWVAAKSGGFHLSLTDENNFFCKVTEESFSQLMSRVLSEQCDSEIDVCL